MGTWKQGNSVATGKQLATDSTSMQVAVFSWFYDKMSTTNSLHTLA